MKVGDVILIHDDKPWLNSKLVVIQELVEGNDGLVRAVNICIKNGTTSRPMAKLYPLEVSSEISYDMLNQDTVQTPNQQVELIVPSRTTTDVGHPSRGAARRAHKQIAEWSREPFRPPEDVDN